MRIFVSSELKAGKINEIKNVRFYWHELISEFVVTDGEHKYFYGQYSDALNLFNSLKTSIELKQRLINWKQKARRIEVI